jgi:acyl-CoA thioester hydrolase
VNPVPEAEPLGVEVWRGGVNTWECDEMGHMNVRFYVARAMEGLVGLAARLGMPKAFSPGAGATLLVREQHIRFLREARPGAPLHMRAWVTEMGESRARLLQVLFHSAGGEPAATVHSLVSHVTPGDAQPFAWSRQTLERAAALTAPTPDYAAPRSVDLAPFESQASLARADALGLATIAAGALGPQDCDTFGRMRPEQLIGRISDGIPALLGQSRNLVAETSDGPVGGAVLEYRLVHLDWPRAGDQLVVRSGLASVDHRIQRVLHWMLDPQTGKAWGVAEAIAVSFDLKTRKMFSISPELQAAIRANAVAGLTL